MCSIHGKAIDDDFKNYPAELLYEWKSLAEKTARREVLLGNSNVAVADLDGLETARLRAAALADLEIFKRTARWPSTEVALSLDIEGYDEPVAAPAIASAVVALDDLMIVAPPGMGKTTILFQIAEALLEGGHGIPLIVPLGDWVTDQATLVESIFNRPSFNKTSVADFREAAKKNRGVVLLLDGWNELDERARDRVRVQVARLQAEMPELSLLVSTRKQALDVPFRGMSVEIVPLSEAQQEEIAVGMRGDFGRAILQEASNTEGIRELVEIPLYLTALLSLPEGDAFPTTKEEVLRLFIRAQEADVAHAQALQSKLQGKHTDYLCSLSRFATDVANTTIGEDNARRAVSSMATLLAQDGQIVINTGPAEVLDILVNNHVLTRSGDVPGFAFQHQQFLEWYASIVVERRIIEAQGSDEKRLLLKIEILDRPAWEEAILFAVERMSRGSSTDKQACAGAIMAAFDVDPMLAAEMIYRATDEVWVMISAPVRAGIEKWHAPGASDRAFRFMLNSGKADFHDQVWPVITHEDQQVSLTALRNCREFRPSVLGSDAITLIKSLSPKQRERLVGEMAWHSGLDGVELATQITKEAGETELLDSVLGALMFRHATRYVAELLEVADDKSIEKIAQKYYWDKIGDAQLQQRLAAARERIAEQVSSASDLLYSALFRDHQMTEAEIVQAIKNLDIGEKRGEQRDSKLNLIHEAHRRYPKATAEGLLLRLREGSDLFYGADDILASAEFEIEDEFLVDLVLADTGDHDERAEAAASVLGPVGAGRLIDVVLELHGKVRDGSSKVDKPVYDLYRCAETRVAHLSGKSLISAIESRSATATSQQIGQLAHLLSRHPSDDTARGRAYSAKNQHKIRMLLKDWANTVLADDTASRSILESLATLAIRVPHTELLPTLRALLDSNLERLSAFRREAEASGYRPSNALDQSRTPMTHGFFRAFREIHAPETTELMKQYLTHPEFGEYAAQVMTSQWLNQHEPKPDRLFFGIDFSRVGANREARAVDPTMTTDEADAIFLAIGQLLAGSPDEKQTNLALALGIAGARLPHGKRDEAIARLVSLTSWRNAPKLLYSLILSGEAVDSQIVVTGIREFLEAAKTQTWLLDDSAGYHLKDWLDLLPFCDRPAAILEVIDLLPGRHRSPHFLEKMVGHLVETPSPGAEDVLFALGEKDSRFYAEYHWNETVLKFGTRSAALKLIDLVANQAIPAKTVSDWSWANRLCRPMNEFAEVRAHIYKVLRAEGAAPHLNPLRRAVAESPDDAGLLLLVEIENAKTGRTFDRSTVEAVVTKRVPDENYKSAFNIVPVETAALRKALLDRALTPADAAARCLTIIDEVRDEYGVSVTETRHPNVASGKSWPFMLPDSNLSH